MQLLGRVPHKIQFSVLLPLVALVSVSCDRDSPTANMAANTNLTASGTANEVQGRYSLIPAGESFYVIDSQTGRVWHRELDPQHNMLVLQSFPYQNIDGALSTVPNETATSVEMPIQRPPTAEEAAEIRAKGLDPSGYVLDYAKHGEQHNEPTNTAHRKDPSAQLHFAITNPSPTRPNVP